MNSMSANYIIIIPFYNRINNLKYNLNFCIQNNLSVYPIIDYPKKDSNFLTNYSIFKQACQLVKDLKIQQYVISNKNVGKTINVINEGFKVLDKYKFVVVLEDDYLITKKYIHYCNTIIKDSDFKIGSGQNVYDATIPSLYTKTLISLPAGSHIYRNDYIVEALKSKLKIEDTVIPNFVDNRSEIFKELIKLYPSNYTSYITSTGEAVEMYERSSELKILFYNLINKVYTFIPKENLTPYNPSDNELNIISLVKYLNKDITYTYLPYFEEDDNYRFNRLYKEFLI